LCEPTDRGAQGMVAHNLAGHERESVDTIESVVPSTRAQSPWPGHAAVSVVGLLGVLYLLLVWRAASLDAQVTLVDAELESAKSAYLRAAHELCARHLEGSTTEDAAARQSAPATPVTGDPLVCPPLPAVQPSALSLLSGSDGSPQPSRPGVSPPGYPTQRIARFRD